MKQSLYLRRRLIEMNLFDLLSRRFACLSSLFCLQTPIFAFSDLSSFTVRFEVTVTTTMLYEKSRGENRSDASNMIKPSCSNQLQQRLIAVLDVPGNQVCCECEAPKPTWASIILPPVGAKDDRPMGALVCFHCVGSHRKLGDHICVLRSLTLDECE